MFSANTEIVKQRNPKLELKKLKTSKNIMELSGN